MTVAVTVNTSRRIRIVAHTQFTQTSGAAGTGTIAIKEGATQLTQSNFFLAGAGLWAAPECSVILTPTAATHTYKLAAHTNTGTVVMTMSAASTYPAYILVEDLGPAS